MIEKAGKLFLPQPLMSDVSYSLKVGVENVMGRDRAAPERFAAQQQYGVEVAIFELFDGLKLVDPIHGQRLTFKSSDMLADYGPAINDEVPGAAVKACIFE